MQRSFNIDRIAIFLNKYGLKSTILNVSPLNGDDNLNLHINLEDGQSLVLRQYLISSKEEIDVELELIDFLILRGFPTAGVLHTQSGRLRESFDGHPAALFLFIDGRHPEEMDIRVGIQLADMLAGIHLLTRDESFNRTRSRTDFARLDALQRMNVLEMNDPLIGGMIDQATAFRRELETQIASSAAELPTGIVHHDIHAGNIIVDSDNRLIGVIDFDEMHVSWLLTDLASLIHYWSMKDGQLLLDDAGRLLKTYNERRTLTNLEWEMLPEFILLFEIAGAAEYVTRALTRDPQRHAVEECHSYRTFLSLNSDILWKSKLRTLRASLR